MKRGELYRVAKPGRGDPRHSRVFIVVSREDFLRSTYSSAVCVPVYTSHAGVPTEVLLDEAHGLKRSSVARCDEITSLPRAKLTDYVGSISDEKMKDVSRALAIALDIEPEDLAGL